MSNKIFNTFFSVAQINVGPQITSITPDGDWLGTALIISTNKDIFLKNKRTIVGIREYNNSLTEEFYDALTYLTIKKVDFDYFINNYFIMEWENFVSEKKPDICNLKKRAYI